MAVNGLKGFGWFLCGVVVAPACYLVSSQVAAERGRLEAVEGAIIQAKKDMRTLETEFDTRANLAQLERWNGDVLALASPTPAQYLPNEDALASLGPNGVTEDARYRHAVYLVPAAVAPANGPVIAASAATPVGGAIETARAEPSAAQPGQRIRSGEAVAMLDRKLLSDSTLGDLVKGARAEATSLR